MENNNLFNNEVGNQAEDEKFTGDTEGSKETYTQTDGAGVQAEVEAKAKEIVEQLKELVKKGNVTHIRVRKDNNIILNLPMTVGVLGTVIGMAAAPWAVIIAAISTIGLSCTVEVEKKDGSRTVIYGKEA